MRVASVIRIPGFLVLFATLAQTLQAQGSQTDQEFFEKSLRVNNAGMAVLGSWAIANIATGAAGWSRNSGTQLYFHQMNLFWNTVNLAIAGAAYFGNRRMEPGSMTGQEMLDRHRKTQNLFLINAGIDIGYMGAGWLMRSLAPRYPDSREQLLGYGQSVFLQGGFLFIFDLVMYGIQASLRSDWLEEVALVPVPEGMSLSLTLKL